MLFIRTCARVLSPDGVRREDEETRGSDTGDRCGPAPIESIVKTGWRSNLVLDTTTTTGQMMWRMCSGG